ncbi:MAG TPA: hypothetical protein VNT32_04990 [Thermoleophilaceae bacterium]|nr:hypothetical protein [Thermoleophilaceae bacterium]
MTIDRGLLATYLNDHLAGATAGRALARRAQGSNDGTPLGEVLARIAREIEEEHGTLTEVMKALGAGKDHLKVAGATIAERLGRFKPNGRLLSYSPLSRVIELEALLIGVTGKLQLWRNLATVASELPELVDFDFAALAEQAERQREELEAQLRLAAPGAFVEG